MELFILCFEESGDWFVVLEVGSFFVGNDIVMVVIVIGGNCLRVEKWYVYCIWSLIFVSMKRGFEKFL